MIRVVNAQEVLDRYLEEAVRNNASIQSDFNEYMASLEQGSQVGTLPDPQLGFGYFILPVETKNGPQQAKISLTQMFPWFGTLDAGEGVAKNIAKAKYETFKEAKSKLHYDVKSAY